MRTFRCPKCGSRVQALATEVGHYCPSHKTKWVRFEEVLVKDDG
jgi:predicted Zn-ribbon and HTH transcriptional regulator